MSNECPFTKEQIEWLKDNLRLEVRKDMDFGYGGEYRCYEVTLSLS